MIWKILTWTALILPFVLATIAAFRWKGSRYSSYWYSRKGAFFGRFFSSLAIATIAWMLGSAILGGFATATSGTKVTSWDTQLRALSTGSEINGRFYFLGSGRIDEEPVFTFLYEQADGGVKLSSVPADKTTVYEQDESDPYMTTNQARMIPNDLWAPFGIATRDSYTYEFRIPEGSILNTYEVAP